MLDVKCPAAELVHPVLSSNESDVECRVQGNLRPSRTRPNPMQTKGKPVVCCAEYAKCPVWSAHKRQMIMDTSVRVAEMQRNVRSGHTLRSGDEAKRENITI